MDQQRTSEHLEAAQKGVSGFLDNARTNGQIDEQSYSQAARNVLPFLRNWLTDQHIPSFSPHVQEALLSAISEERWEDIVNAFRQPVRFGTGGIRGMMAFDRRSIERLAEQGVDAAILKGTNTINDVVLLLTSVGVAQFGRERKPPFTKVVVGYDSRIRGRDFATLVAQLFLYYGYTVYFFDEPCPYPEITFAIPHRDIKADVGILISASHNDYRYNGYKLSCCNGSQFDPKERNAMYDQYIANAKTSDVRLLPFKDAKPGQLIFLGGDTPVAGFDYLGRQASLVNMHREHCNHVKTFLLTPDLAERQAKSASPLSIAYCAFHGVGRKAVPRLLAEVGFQDVRVITHGGLNDLNGFFPSFESAPGREQQPDPGDTRAARKAVEAFKAQAKQDTKLGKFEDVDILIGTDPDADRCGVVAKVPKEQQSLYGEDWTLLPADSMWAVLLWYRLHREVEQYGKVRDAEKKFIVLSHTTSDAITLVARKYGLGVIKTWVGFASLAAAVRDVWEHRPIPELIEGRGGPKDAVCHPFICDHQGITEGTRSINVAAMEQSNGFSILGGPPPDDRSLGAGGHVRDKDGTMAALLIAEIAAWAKEQGTTLFELIDRHIHLDPDVGLFVNHYEPDPLDGEYPGIQGDRKKVNILRRALGYFQLANSGDLTIAGRAVSSAVIYRTGKYDAIYEPTYDFQFPDEGVRFYLGTAMDHVTVRPSGTGNSLRFHIQLRDPAPGPDATALLRSKKGLMDQAVALADDIRRLLRAPRN